MAKNSKIELNVINKGKIVSKNFVSIGTSKTIPELRLNKLPISNNFHIITFPDENKNYSIIFLELPELNNQTLTINNSINCGWQFNCRAYNHEDSNQKCEYYCENNRCKISAIN